MCGHYFLEDANTSKEIKIICDAITQRYRDSNRSVVLKYGQINPTDSAPVLVEEQQVQQPVLMKWGYPKWQGSGVLINARAETAADKPTFMQSIDKRRCIIPASGFFEWEHHKEGAKTKYLLTDGRSPIIHMAGLYSVFENPQGEKYAAYVILTVNANESVRQIHERMPLIIEPGQSDLWLTDANFAKVLLQSPCPAMLTALKV
jgi:putative SOS response-associated peptidase YedK